MNGVVPCASLTLAKVRWLAMIVTLTGCGRIGFDVHDDAAGDGASGVDALDLGPCTPFVHTETNVSVFDYPPLGWNRDGLAVGLTAPTLITEWIHTDGVTVDMNAVGAADWADLVTTDDGFLLAWETGGEVRIQTLDAKAALTGSPIVAGSSPSKPTMARQGNEVATLWLDGANQLIFQRRDLTGAALAAPLPINDGLLGTASQLVAYGSGYAFADFDPQTATYSIVIVTRDGAIERILPIADVTTGLPPSLTVANSNIYVATTDTINAYLVRIVGGDTVLPAQIIEAGYVHSVALAWTGERLGFSMFYLHPSQDIGLVLRWLDLDGNVLAADETIDSVPATGSITNGDPHMIGALGRIAIVQDYAAITDPLRQIAAQVCY